MSDQTLLPVGSSKLERNLSQTLAAIADIPVPINLLWQAEHCPDAMLPWLAWSLSVDEWDDNWSDEQKRQTILNSINVHKTKGTINSIRRVFFWGGYGDVTIIENTAAIAYDGTKTHNGDYVYGAIDTHWATYRIYLNRPITIDQAEQVRQMLANTAPARCHLAGLHYEQAANIYNGRIDYNGEYTYGVA